MSTSYILYHFRPLTDGIGRRRQLLAEALANFGSVREAGSLAQLWRAMRAASSDRRIVVLFFSSLALPTVAAIKRIRPRVELCYMVRGDEYTWAKHFGRGLRARAALWFQRALARLGCRFVFASEDLKEAFESRLGPLAASAVLPNTLGAGLPPIRPFDGRVAVVGDFGGVKNIEAVLDGLSSGSYRLDLYGNTTLPGRYRQRWVYSHGEVGNLTDRLKESSVLVLASKSEGFPNVLLDALAAGCAVVAHDGFPFRRLPLKPTWRFSTETEAGKRGEAANLQTVLARLQEQQRDFKKDNPELVGLVESDWVQRVREVLT